MAYANYRLAESIMIRERKKSFRQLQRMFLHAINVSHARNYHLRMEFSKQIFF